MITGAAIFATGVVVGAILVLFGASFGASSVREDQ